MALSVSALMGFDCMSLGDGIYLQQLHQKTTDLQDIYDISRAVVEAQGQALYRSIPFKYSTGDHLIMSSHIIGVISLDCKCFRIGVMWCTKSWDLLRSSFMQTGQVFRFHTWNRIIILTRLSNGPDKKETNNSYENIGMQKCANFTIVRTLLLIGRFCSFKQYIV